MDPLDPEQTPPPSPETQPKAPHAHKRNGFVAQRPKALRDKINLMLLDGFTSRKVLESLGEEGKGLNEDHIGSWYRGGFQDFLDQLDRKDALRSNREDALDLLKQEAGKPTQDAARTVASVQVYELLLSFNPATFTSSLADKPELYLRLINTLSRLCESESTTAYRRLQEAITQAKLVTKPGDDHKKLLSLEELKEIARQIKLL